jgi:predicted nucleotide-binding protein
MEEYDNLYRDEFSLVFERKRFELQPHVRREVEKDSTIAALIERSREATDSLHRALLDDVVLPYAHSWVEDYLQNRKSTSAEASLNEAKGATMANGNEEATSLTTVEDNSLASVAGAPGPGDHRSVFLVHGRDMRTVRAMRDLLRALGLRVVEWEHAVAQTGQAAPFTGDVVLAGMGMADAVLILLTPDDVVQLRPDLVSDGDPDDEREVRGQARPNVLYEAGIADALDRSRTLFVQVGNVKSPSDLSGRNMIRFDGEAQSRDRLIARLRSAGLIVDRSSEDWLRAGEFKEPISRAQKALKDKGSP